MPRSAVSHLDEVLRLEIGRATPFASSEVLTGWYELPVGGADDYASIAHVIVRKDLVAPVIGKVLSHGNRIARIEVSADGEILPLDLRPSLQIAEGPAIRRWRGVTIAAAATAVALAFAAGGLILSRQSVEIDLLDQRLKQAEAEARVVRDKIDAIERSSLRVAGLRKERLNSPSPLAVWSELTRLLPDTAWLSGLSISEADVTLDGTAQSAEDLITLLDGSPLFEKVAFTGPVTKLPGGSLDRFSISLALSRPETVAGLAVQ